MSNDRVVDELTLEILDELENPELKPLYKLESRVRDDRAELLEMYCQKVKIEKKPFKTLTDLRLQSFHEEQMTLVIDDLIKDYQACIDWVKSYQTELDESSKKHLQEHRVESLHKFRGG